MFVLSKMLKQEEIVYLLGTVFTWHKGGGTVSIYSKLTTDSCVTGTMMEIFAFNIVLIWPILFRETYSEYKSRIKSISC